MSGKSFFVEVQPVLPDRLERLKDLSLDLYYTWNRSVRRLFRHLDETTWHRCGHNPRLFLRRVPQRRLDEAAEDPILMAEYRGVLSEFDTYMESGAHTRTDAYLRPGKDLVAYFSAEFGFHHSIPIYAGGLGILAGDYCKAMSNLRIPFVGVGLLYRQGYFTQRILGNGEQEEFYTFNDARDLPVNRLLDANGQPIEVQVELGRDTVRLEIWEARAGHIRLFLLDSDLPANRDDLRQITSQLYGGDGTMRIRQESVLGIGGVRALRAVGLNPNVWHMNEGHAAFLVLERCREYRDSGMDFDSAWERTAADAVFTTHTPVPAGHDIFHQDLVREHFRPMIEKLGIDEERFLQLGRNERSPLGFNMTTLAMRGSRFHNGVSQIHGRVASEMEAHIWPQIPAAENPMGHVTNGVDVDTWIGDSWVSLFDLYKGGGWRTKLTDADFWRQFIGDLPTHVFMSARRVHKAALFEYALQRWSFQLRRNGASEALVRQLTRYLRHPNLDTLVVGFARRFATYKRATLLFRDLERLTRLIGDSDRPLMLIFAGKAHPRDEPGRGLLREVARISMLPEFQGKLILLEDYNIAMARELMAGVDVWLNNPEYPKEACGTSGMKAAVNGAVNLSVPDGWWGEAYNEENGWSITPHAEASAQDRDCQEAEELLDILEREVIPLYYQRNRAGEPEAWIRKSKASMYSVIPRFNSIRMALDYIEHYYAPARKHGERLSNNSGAVSLAAWKRETLARWPGVSLRMAREIPEAVRSGNPITVTVALQLNGIRAQDVVVECVMGFEDGMQHFNSTCTHRLESIGTNKQGETEFFGDLADSSHELHGLIRYKIRVYPHHPDLAKRFELGCMLWL
ncbi:MAG: alpha-glucan family phosphorylase [Chromatiales bacterium]|nr:alpha-glucan family phosphorylase [Chromatiales bacterium]